MGGVGWDLGCILLLCNTRLCMEHCPPHFSHKECSTYYVKLFPPSTYHTKNFPCHNPNNAADVHYTKEAAQKKMINVQKGTEMFQDQPELQLGRVWCVALLVREGDLIAALEGGYYCLACNRVGVELRSAQAFWATPLLFIYSQKWS